MTTTDGNSTPSKSQSPWTQGLERLINSVADLPAKLVRNSREGNFLVTEMDILRTLWPKGTKRPQTLDPPPNTRRPPGPIIPKQHVQGWEDVLGIKSRNHLYLGDVFGPDFDDDDHVTVVMKLVHILLEEEGVQGREKVEEAQSLLHGVCVGRLKVIEELPIEDGDEDGEKTRINQAHALKCMWGQYCAISARLRENNGYQ